MTHHTDAEHALFEAVASDDGKWPQAIERDAKGNYLLLTTANGRMWWQAARRAPAAPVPQGWKLVPVEPTAQMKRAAQIADMDHSPHSEWLKDEWQDKQRVWSAMLAAAPQPEAQAAPPLVLDAERAAHYSQVVHHANVNASVSYVQRKTGLSFMLVGELMELALKNGDIAKGDYAGRKLEHYQDDRVASLQARIAELEAARDAKQAVQMPEPVAFALEWTFNGEERGMRLYDDETHCRFDAESDGGVCNPLYTEQQVRQILAAHSIKEQST